MAGCTTLVDMLESCGDEECLQLTAPGAAAAAEHLPHVVWLHSVLDPAVLKPSDDAADSEYLRANPAFRPFPIRKKVHASEAVLSRLQVEDCVGAANSAAFLGHMPLLSLLCGYLGERAATDIGIAALLVDCTDTVSAEVRPERHCLSLAFRCHSTKD